MVLYINVGKYTVRPMDPMMGIWSQVFHYPASPETLLGTRRSAWVMETDDFFAWNWSSKKGSEDSNKRQQTKGKLHPVSKKMCFWSKTYSNKRQTSPSFQKDVLLIENLFQQKANFTQFPKRCAFDRKLIPTKGKLHPVSKKMCFWSKTTGIAPKIVSLSSMGPCPQIVFCALIMGCPGWKDSEDPWKLEKKWAFPLGYVGKRNLKSFSKELTQVICKGLLITMCFNVLLVS